MVLSKIVLEISLMIKIKMMIKMMMMKKNTPGAYINHMLVSDGAKRRALRARRLVRPPITYYNSSLIGINFQRDFYRENWLL